MVIRVRASSFNYHDVFTMRGMPGIKVPLPVIIGLDMAGVIADVGAGVTGWKAGDRVLVNPLNKTKGLMGEMMDGGMAEYCLVAAADQLIAMPAGVSFEQAASLPVAYGTAHRMLITHDTVKKGERVIVLGASGGVGTGCVMLAKHLGAEVIACTSSVEKVAKLKEFGADEVINIKDTDFSKWAVEKYGKPQRELRGRPMVIQLHRRRHLAPVAALPWRRRCSCARHCRHDEGGLALRLELRLKIIGRTASTTTAGADEVIADGRMKPDRQGTAAGTVPRACARSGSRSDRQGGGGAVILLSFGGRSMEHSVRGPRSGPHGVGADHGG